MAYDPDLVERTREVIPLGLDLTEQRMFGGLAFLVGGHMAVAVSGQGGLLVRVDPERTDALAERTGASIAIMRGRPATGWLRVDADAVRTKRQLQSWVDIGVAQASSLPAKRKHARPSSSR